MDRPTLQKAILTGLLVCTAITIIIIFRDSLFTAASHFLAAFQAWLKDNMILGSLLFVLAQGAAACILLPVTAFGVLAGSIFPFFIAVLLVLIGNQVGILISIALGRTFLRPWVQKKLSLHPKMKAIDKAMAEDGFKLAVLLRLTPVFPFGLCNWIFATSQVAVSSICIGSLLGNIPNTLIHCSVGALVGYGGSMPPKLQHLTILLTVCFAVGSSIFITLMAKKALRNVVDLDSYEEEEVRVNVADLENAHPSSSLPTHSRQDTGASSSLQSQDHSHVYAEECELLTPPAANSHAKEKPIGFTRQETQLLQITFASVTLALCIGVPLILI